MTREVPSRMAAHEETHDRDIHEEMLRVAAKLRAAAGAASGSSSGPVAASAAQLFTTADRIDPNGYALAQPGDGSALGAVRAAMDELRAVQAEFQLTSTPPMLTELEEVLATIRRGDG